MSERESLFHHAFRRLQQHYSVDLDDLVDGGFVKATCGCGADLGVYPTYEDAADALMWHAYERGIRDEAESRAEQFVSGEKE
jgi:hypothetical protein